MKHLDISPLVKFFATDSDNYRIIRSNTDAFGIKRKTEIVTVYKPIKIRVSATSGPAW